MAKLYLKIDVDFILVDKDDEKILNETYNKDTEYGIQLTCRSKEGADIDISFDVEPKNSEGGTLNHKLDNSELKITCNGIFKVNVKSNYESDFLDKKALWLFDSFGDYGPKFSRYPIKIKGGLKEEEYEFKRRGNLVKGLRYPIEIITYEKKAGL